MATLYIMAYLTQADIETLIGAVVALAAALTAWLHAKAARAAAAAAAQHEAAARSISSLEAQQQRGQNGTRNDHLPPLCIRHTQCGVPLVD